MADVEGMLVVSNASAGTNEAEAIQAAIDVLERSFDVELVATADHDELRACLEELDGRNLTVAGGDGSLHAVMNALLCLDLLETVRLGLIPLGSRWVANFSPLMTMVWPALLPPW